MSALPRNAPSFRVEEIDWGAVSATEWDTAIQSARGSYLLAHRRLSIWRRSQRARGAKVRVLKLLASGQEAGLCIVHSRDNIHTLRERLLLFPGQEMWWAPALSAVLEHIGSGTYRYGPSSSVSPSRASELGLVSGVSITDAKPYAVQAVDFSRYGSWNEYLYDLKPGIRNECRRAETRHDLELVATSGRGIWRAIGRFVLQLHRQPHRKGRRLAELRQVLSLILSTATLRTSTVMFTAASGSEALATQYHVDFGSDRYYAAGAATHMQPSPAWWLTIQAFKDAWERNPNGRVILGSFYPHLHDGKTGEGLLDFRRRCRAISFESEILEFRFQREEDQPV
ncbi:hypothetical protein [Novosphingobium jiangmenense]|uniref:Uncharacterized protein n=1 Tax=Novosphingobium jiangmenense TaxID=2791981 RepID=A0ABS0HD82_9SPHN|nr:hypothetical protein [Novosphingobium jiangmenense]MBF9150229.1 hypothetical protein [Novosphingobium jiangmenense]